MCLVNSLPSASVTSLSVFVSVFSFLRIRAVVGVVSISVVWLEKR